jgi:hypothetical protein
MGTPWLAGANLVPGVPRRLSTFAPSNVVSGIAVDVAALELRIEAGIGIGKEQGQAPTRTRVLANAADLVFAPGSRARTSCRVCRAGSRRSRRRTWCPGSPSTSQRSSFASKQLGAVMLARGACRRLSAGRPARRWCRRSNAVCVRVRVVPMERCATAVKNGWMPVDFLRVVWRGGSCRPLSAATFVAMVSTLERDVGEVGRADGSAA